MVKSGQVSGSSRRLQSLRAILIATFLPVVLLPLAIVALAVAWQNYRESAAVEQTIRAELLDVAGTNKELLESLMRNAVDQAELIAALWPGLESDPQPNAALARLVYRSRAFSRLSVVSAEGRVVASSAPARVGMSFARRPYWAQFQRARRATFSGLLIEPGGWRVVQILLPLAAGRALVATYDAQQLQQAFHEQGAIRHQRIAFIVDAQGQIVARSNERVLTSERDMSDLPPVRAALKGAQGAVSFRDPFDHVDRTAAFRQLPLTGWSLITMQPSARAMLLPPETAQRATALVLLIGGLLAIVATTLCSRRLARPVQALGAYLDSLARSGGRLESRPPAPVSSIREYAGVTASAEALFEALASTIGQLEARSNELRLGNQQQAATVEKLRRLDRLRSEFLDALGHDLRIPLTAVRGYAELLHDMADPPLGDEGREYVAQIEAGCARMQAMAEELLDYARLEEGRLGLHPERLDLGELLQRLADFFAPLARQKSQQLQVERPPQRLEVLADPDRLEQVFNNLISNALKYTPRNGTVTVRSWRQPDAVGIEVCDTGIGLTPDDMAHLFEKFYRSPRSEVQAEAGSGLGLVLAKGLIEAHGGRLEVESLAGRGSTFRFFMPLDSADRPARLAAERASEGASP